LGFLFRKYSVWKHWVGNLDVGIGTQHRFCNPIFLTVYHVIILMREVAEKFALVNQEVADKTRKRKI
jgi:hypothetical protein